MSSPPHRRTSDRDQRARPTRAGAAHAALRCCARAIALGALLGAAAAPSSARDSRFDLGIRLNLVGGSGKPTNDVLGYGVNARYELGERWAIGFGFDRADEFDVERSAQLVGLTQSAAVEDIDHKASATALRFWLDLTYGTRDSRFRLFWTAGVGANELSFENATGPLAGGGRFDIAVEAGTELMVEGSLGVRVRAGSAWAFEAAACVIHHFADWDLVDRVSGNQGSIGDYTLRGLRLGLRYHF